MSGAIVVGVDGSRASSDAVRWSLAEARRRGNSVLLVHAVDAADAQRAAATGTTVAECAADVAGAHRRYALQIAPDLRIRIQVTDGAAADVLAELSRRVGLVVVGGGGPAGMSSSALGSVGPRLAAHAHCPVVVVPQGSSQLVTRRVLVQFEPGDAAEATAGFAADEAGRWDATLCLVQLCGAGDEQRDALRQELDDVAARVHRQHPLVVTRTQVVDGAEALLAEAAQADLLVLGCQHTDERFGCRIGAVSAAVLAQPPCPVVLIGSLTSTSARFGLVAAVRLSGGRALSRQ
jgi:nucleotide-binding universal stress UspA family protein